MTIRPERWMWIFLVTSIAFARAPETKTPEFKSGLLRVQLHDPQDRTLMQGVYTAFRQSQADLKAIGLELPQVRLEAFENASAFARATGEPTFVAASTQANLIRTQRLRALKSRGLLEFTIRHELFHCAQPINLPRWLAEGLARHFSGEDRQDARAASGLESLSDTQLDLLLLARGSESSLQRVYREATRRATKLIGTKGWKYALKWQTHG